jgi:hypothetical protein
MWKSDSTMDILDEGNIYTLAQTLCFSIGPSVMPAVHEDSNSDVEK